MNVAVEAMVVIPAVEKRVCNIEESSQQQRTHNDQRGLRPIAHTLHSGMRRTENTSVAGLGFGNMPGKRGTRTSEVLLHISGNATNQDLAHKVL